MREVFEMRIGSMHVTGSEMAASMTHNSHFSSRILFKVLWGCIELGQFMFAYFLHIRSGTNAMQCRGGSSSICCAA